MKTFKKMMALMIAVVMCMAMAISVYAEDETVYETTKEYTVTINDNSHTTFNAIQIFKGTQKITGNDDEPLGNIAWGDNTTGKTADIITAVNTVLGLSGTDALPNTAEAKIVAEKISGATDAQAVALSKALDAVFEGVTGTTVQTGDNKLPVGYYLIVDNSTLGDNDAKNMSLLQLTKDVEITPKTDAPKIEKKLKNEGELIAAYRDINNVAIGDKVNYKLTAKIPDMTYYDQYYFIVTDKLSGGLTYDPNSLKIAIYDGENKLLDIPAANYEATPATAPAAGTDTNIEIVFKNFIQYKNYGAVEADPENNVEAVAGTDYKGKDIVITYDATLNTKAVIGTDGNPNEVQLEYSNNPNKKGEGENKPGDNDHVTGITPKDYTITYTTNLKLYKIDKATQQKMAGVTFNIKGYKKNDVDTYTEEYVEDSTNGTYYKLNNDTYTTKAPTALTTADYASTSVKYRLDVKKSTNTVITPINKTATTDENGYIDVGAVLKDDETGTVAAGKYVITETETLDGYNLLDEAITVVIEHSVNDAPDATATSTSGEETCTWTYTVNGPVKSGSAWDATQKAYVITVENGKGSTLPETGGIGTTIFYVIGAILVVGAGVVLVTRRRMSAN